MEEGRRIIIISLAKICNFFILIYFFKLERQIQMNNAMRERQMAMQLARAREMFSWWATFYGISTIAMIGG